MTRALTELEAARAGLLRQLAAAGDMRRGSITEVFRRCGKDNCACASPGHPGHGPFYAHTTKVNGKTKTLQLRPGARLSKLEQEVAEYKKFRATSERVIDVNEQICNARAVPGVDLQEKKGARRRLPEANQCGSRSADRARGACPPRLRGHRDRGAPGSPQSGGLRGRPAPERRPY